MGASRSLAARKRIALVAHDKKKSELLNWATEHREELVQHELVATGTTGRLLEEKLGCEVKQLLSGPLGGDQQLGAMIAEGRIDVIFFFWDPMEAQAHDSDVKALLRLAVAWNIIMACNRTTADFILQSTCMHGEYDLSLPDYSTYLGRNIGK